MESYLTTLKLTGINGQRKTKMMGFDELQLSKLKRSEVSTNEREREIVQVVESVNELAQIMSDLSVLVIDQGTIIDRIDYNIQNVATSVEDGYKQLQRDLPFIMNLEKRIQSATELLDHSLGNRFKAGLEHHDEDAIYICLCAYAAIDNTSAAEDIFRMVIVAPLIQKIIPYNQSQIIDGSSSDELEEYYQKIKLRIKNDFKFILDISSIENSGLHVFDFLANSILKEVHVAIQKGKPGALHSLLENLQNF